VVVIQLG